MEHTVVYRQAGRFAGWPANYGIWAWGDEIVVGFTVGYVGEDTSMHARDKTRPFMPMQARSLDGGRTWQVQPTPCRTPGGRGLSADEHVIPELQTGPVLDGPDGLVDAPGGIRFDHPDFALMCARTGLSAGARSWFYVSYDRCRSWEGPYRLPMFGQSGVAARTDYIVGGSDECTLFLTAAKSNGKEGRPFCASTTDGGKSFLFLSWIGAEPQGYVIMPASVRLSEGHFLVAVRDSGRPVQEGGWIDLYESTDGGRTWAYLSRPVANTGRGGNPPTLTKLADGRLAVTYGYRDEPYGMRAVISADQGRSWSTEYVLRADGGNNDIGYPRTVQRADGKLVTVYYYNDDPKGDRYIAATIWEA